MEFERVGEKSFPQLEDLFFDGRGSVQQELIRFCADYAKRLGFDRLELNMWEFNSEALAFYEAVGFTTYRRHMELQLRDEENEKESDR